MTYAIE